MNSNSINSSDDCNSCIRFLKQILEQPESRPRILLNGLMGKYHHDNNKNKKNDGRNSASNPSHDCKFRSIKDGIEVHIPMDSPPILNPRRWTKVGILPSRKSSKITQQQHHQMHQQLKKEAETTKTTTKIIDNSFFSISSASSETTTKAEPKNNKYHIEKIKIRCRPCNDFGQEKDVRAMIMGPTPLSIVACTNRLQLKDKQELEEVLTHELVHAYDVQQLQLDFMDCESVAYSEIRAAREAECYTSWDFMKGICIKQKATAATNIMFPRRGEECIKKVFETSMKDNRPFSFSSASNH